MHPEIPRFEEDRLTKLKLLGHGGFGSVWLYSYSPSDQAVSKLVAVKRLLETHMDDSDIAKLRKESLILRDLKCEYVISLEGLLYSDNQFSLVLEYAPNGSCYDLFRKLREARLCQLDENKIWPLKCRIGEEVVEGMAFLHSRRPSKILHIDLKAANVLLNKDFHVKISDFGLAQMQTLTGLTGAISTYQTTDGIGSGDRSMFIKDAGGQNKRENVGGTISHIAPEHLRNPNTRPTVKTDSYSYGIFVWELLSNSLPYQYAPSLKALINAICESNNIRPDLQKIPEGAPEFLKEIMHRCWDDTPLKRPSFTDIKEIYGREFHEKSVHAHTAVEFLAIKEICPKTTDSDQHPVPSLSGNLDVAKLMRSRVNENQEGWASLHTLNNNQTDQDNQIISTEGSCSSLGQQIQPQSPLVGLMRSRTNENRNAWTSLHSIERPLVSASGEYEQIQEPVGSQRSSADEIAGDGNSFTSSVSAQGIGTVSDPLIPYYTQVENKNALYFTKKRVAKWLVFVLLILMFLSGGILVTLYLTHGSSFCFLSNSCGAVDELSHNGTNTDMFTVTSTTRMNFKPNKATKIENPQKGFQQAESAKLPETTNTFQPFKTDKLSNTKPTISRKVVQPAELKSRVGCENIQYLHAEGSQPLLSCQSPSTSHQAVVCMLYCLDGYILHGSDRVECRQGRPGNSTAKCRKAAPTCPIKRFIGGRLVCNGFDVDQVESGDVCQIRCDDRYKLRGLADRQCMSDGTWSKAKGECLMECPFDVIPHNVISKGCTNGNLTGSECSYTCGQDRIQLSIPLSRRCLRNGQWDKPLPSCPCATCHYGTYCENQYTYSRLSAQLDQLKADKSPIELNYGDETITCESDVDIWFINYDCTCRGPGESEATCNDYLTRRAACRHAASSLLRNAAPQRLIPEPCDLAASYVAC